MKLLAQTTRDELLARRLDLADQLAAARAAVNQDDCDRLDDAIEAVEDELFRDRDE